MGLMNDPNMSPPLKRFLKTYFTSLTIFVVAVIARILLLELPWIYPIGVFLNNYFLLCIMLFLLPFVIIQTYKLFSVNTSTTPVPLIDYNRIDNAQSAIDVMRINLKEITGYYEMNKKQARTAFTASVLSCTIGFILICAGVFLVYMNIQGQNTISQIAEGEERALEWHNAINASIIGLTGVLSEVIASLFLAVYNKTIKQINLFYQSLNDKEKFLSIIELARGLTGENRDKAISEIIAVSIIPRKKVTSS